MVIKNKQKRIKIDRKLGASHDFASSAIVANNGGHGQ